MHNDICKAIVFLVSCLVFCFTLFYFVWVLCGTIFFMQRGEKFVKKKKIIL